MYFNILKPILLTIVVISFAACNEQAQEDSSGSIGLDLPNDHQPIDDARNKNAVEPESTKSQAIADANDQQDVIAEEPVNPLATQALNNRVVATLENLGSEQAVQQENSNQDTLNELSESDRQALIDMTIESSAQQVAEDSEEVIQDRQPQN